MSGWIGIGVRLNDKSVLYARGYTRSAYNAFSYMGIFEGDDTGARKFMTDWNDGATSTPRHLPRDEYGSLFVDIPGRKIVIDDDVDINITACAFAISTLEKPFIRAMMEAGRVSLAWLDGSREPWILSKEFAKAAQERKLFDSSVLGFFGIDKHDLVRGAVELRFDYAPFEVIACQRGEAGRLAYVREAEAAGLALDPAYYTSKDQVQNAQACGAASG